jgi:nicotinamide mononucleotide transporter
MELVRGSGSFTSVNIDPATISEASVATTPCAGRKTFGLRPLEIWTMLAASLLVLLPSYRQWWSINATEAWGFVTGGICVWLVVREHMWNWPIGLINNIVFFILFLHGRLFADMSLQLVYLGLGVYGWLNWLLGGEHRTVLKISRTSRIEWLLIAAFIPLGTYVFREILLAVNGAAPFWDSLTTVLSLAAQYLLCRKRFENWLLWIAADAIYIPLYLSRHLPLTAVLYAVFLGMCLIGVYEWNRSIKLESIHQ